MEWPVNDVPSSFTGPADSSELVSLLSATASGDRAAFRELYRRTAGKLYGIALQVLGDEARAEDVVQDVYVTVWKKAAQFDSARGSPISWMAIITRNRAIDRKREIQPSAPVELALEIPSDEASAEQLVGQQQETLRLQGCLETLDERARRLIREAFISGLSYPELADREAVPLGTMKSWVRRGLLRLKACLES